MGGFALKNVISAGFLTQLPYAMRYLNFWAWLLPLALISCQTGPANQGTLTDQAPKEPVMPEEDLGSLFHEVQMAGLFEDSKTFVDCRPQAEPELILSAYLEMKDQEDFDLESFVQQNFLPPRVFNPDFESNADRSVDEHILALWPVLTRQPDEDISGSLLELPYSYVVPGGRFREIYYWDSYFTMLGLQVSPPENQALIGEMIANFGYLIDTLGFIPNGNRTYFRSRSQPPFFSLMVKLWQEEKPGTVEEYLPQLEKEYAFWMAGRENLSAEEPTHRRVVRLPDGTVLNRYWDDIPEARPESYREDVELAEGSDRDEEELFRNLRAACESGWDFSSRWLRDGQNLGSIRTTELIPVDLNCLLWHLEQTLAEAYEAQGQTDRSVQMRTLADQRQAAIEQYCWNETEGYYVDFDWVKGQPHDMLTAATMFPLFFEIASDEHAAATHEALREGLLADGGVLTTPLETGQQWDAPNGWAPLQWVAYQGLHNYSHDQTAETVKQRWITLNTRVYQNTGRMVEKYNVVDMSLEAGGGEYALQDGFGWSNGVLLRMMRAE